MTLYIRMILYFIFGNVSGSGITFDASTGHITISIDDLATAIVGVIGFVATFVVSRFAKKR